MKIAIVGADKVCVGLVNNLILSNDHYEILIIDKFEGPRDGNVLDFEDFSGFASTKFSIKAASYAELKDVDLLIIGAKARAAPGQLEQDFYEYEPKEKWDIIISNPPFKGKHRLLARLLEFNKPWALIFGIQALNSEKFCHELQKFKRVQYIHLKRRMCFTKDHLNYDIKNLQRPSFASMWIANDLFDKDILVWNGVNYKKDGKEFF